MKGNLLTTAGTIKDIRQSVCRFYCGESKTLIPIGDDSWKIVGTYNGKECEGVRVVRKRGRYRFEMI